MREIYKTIKGKKYPVTIENFTPCYPWEQIEFTLPKREYKQFCKWMSGQTCPIGGVYTWDFDRWMKELPNLD